MYSQGHAFSGLESLFQWRKAKVMRDFQYYSIIERQRRWSFGLCHSHDMINYWAVEHLYPFYFQGHNCGLNPGAATDELRLQVEDLRQLLREQKEEYTRLVGEQKEEYTRLAGEQNEESARLRADLTMLKIEVERLKGQGQGNSGHSLEVSNHYFLL